MGEEGRHFPDSVMTAAIDANCIIIGFAKGAHQLKLILTIKAFVFIKWHMETCC